jgi:glycerol kinase
VSILVIDVGTSSVRAALVNPDATVTHVSRRPAPPSVPFAGLVEFDPAAVAAAALDAAEETMTAAPGRAAAVAVTTQRSSAVAWDAGSGRPLGPGLGWQDLRTVGKCLEMQGFGLRFSPSESATKFAWLVEQAGAAAVGSLRLGTVDSWIAWNLTRGDRHITDATNAGVTGLYSAASRGWRGDALDRLGLDPGWLPSIVDSSGDLGTASALGGLPLCALVGDQQASLVGQSCTRPGLAKATFGTGGMLDVCLGGARPAADVRTEAGCFPIVAWQIGGGVTWGSEAIMLAAGTAVDWLVEDLGILERASDSELVAAACDDTDGVVMVPALSGFGTPQWDFGARGAVFGLTRGSGRPQFVRAVLEGVAHSGADLLEATERDTGLTIDALRVDGGMSANGVFIQALADACGRPVEVSRELEATTLGAGYLAGLVTGDWKDMDEVAGAWRPRTVVPPSDRDPRRDRWREAVSRAAGWYPELSGISF